jgi:hypothetical protein
MVAWPPFELAGDAADPAAIATEPPAAPLESPPATEIDPASLLDAPVDTATPPDEAPAPIPLPNDTSPLPADADDALPNVTSPLDPLVLAPLMSDAEPPT